MKLSFKFSLLNLASIGLIIWMIYIIMTNPSHSDGGDGLSNFFPVVGILSGVTGLILDLILQAMLSNRVKVNIIGFIIILIAAGSLIYVLKN